MEFKIEKRDLFTVPTDYILCHCISADFALGAGIAKQFDERFNLRKKLKDISSEDKDSDERFEWNNAGSVIMVIAEDLLKPYENQRIIANLVTKKFCYQKPTYKSLRESLDSLNTFIDALIKMRKFRAFNTNTKPESLKLAMPRIGCGIDRLDYDNAQEIIKDVFHDTDVEILICEL